MNTFGLHIVSDLPWYFVGLDLGQSRDHSAIAVVERSELFLNDMDWVTYERKRRRRFRVRYLERIRLGTPYPDVVERVRQLVRGETLAGRCTLIMDATGVGAPVLDFLRAAGLSCGIETVIITAGERANHAGGRWHVPKRDLIAGLRVMLENRELGLSRQVPMAEALAREMSSMEARVSSRGRETYGAAGSGYEDLVLACALACWRGRSKGLGMWGVKSLGLG